MGSKFGAEWHSVKSLDEGGQGFVYTASREGDEPERRYVIKSLKNPNRQDRFDREIQAIKRLDHPNILRLVDTGIDNKGCRFLVTEYIAGGTLADFDLQHQTELENFKVFFQICQALEYCHSQGIIHRDIKPENVFMRDGKTPVVGDFGICYVEEDGQLTRTEDVMGSRYYCAPELRDGRIDPEIPKELADVYSLGKVLYWIFTKRVFDREDPYQTNQIAFAVVNGDTVVRPVQLMMAAVLVDDLVRGSVVADPSLRLVRTVQHFRAKVEKAIDQIRAFGRPLDLRLPKRCLFCGEGEYQPLHERTDMPIQGAPFPSLERRKKANPSPSIPSQSDRAFERLTSAADVFMSRHQRGFPLYLVCDLCGNVQYFRLDLTSDKHGEKWKPWE